MPSVGKKVICAAFLCFVYCFWILLWYCLLHSIYQKDLEASITYMLALFCYIQLIVCGKLYFREENEMECYKKWFKVFLYMSMPVISTAAAVISTMATGFSVMVAIMAICTIIEVGAILFYTSYYICCRSRNDGAYINQNRPTTYEAIDPTSSLI